MQILHVRELPGAEEKFFFSPVFPSYYVSELFLFTSLY